LGGPKLGTPFALNVAEDFVELLRDESSGSIETTPD
jgi:hypothetical protein